MRSKTFILLALAIVALPLSAQQVPRPWLFHWSAGWPAPMGKTSDVANGRFDMMLGAMKVINPNFGVRIDGTYDSFNATGRITQGYLASGGHAEVWSLSVDPQYGFGDTGRSHAYVFGGIGTSYKKTYLTDPGTGVVCDPWWGICYPVGVDVIKAKQTDTAFSANVGVGYAMPLSVVSSWFVEAKYQWVNTPRATAQYIPISIGVRW